MNNSVYLENKLLNEEEIRQKKLVLGSRVRSLVVTLTTKCNISCIMCEEKAIPWDIPERVIAEIISLMPYLEQIIWQGGEVLILDYFKALLEEASKHQNLHQSIITNGIPITESLAQLLVRDNMELTFSIDAATKDLYESIRKKASFERLLENIELVNGLRKKGSFKNMSFRMHTVVMNSNYEQLEKFVDFAGEYEFDGLHLMPIWGNLEGEENIFYHNNTKALSYIKANIAKAERKAKEYNLNLLNSLPFSGDSAGEVSGGTDEGIHNGMLNDKKMLCHMPWKRMVINPAGYVCPACHCKEMSGNVSEDTLNNIWNNKKMQEYRAKVSGGDYSDLCGAACVNGIISEELRGLK